MSATKRHRYQELRDSVPVLYSAPSSSSSSSAAYTSTSASVSAFASSSSSTFISCTGPHYDRVAIAPTTKSQILSHSYISVYRSLPASSPTAMKQYVDIKQQLTDRLEKIGVELLNLSPRKAAALAVEYLRFMNLKAALNIDDQPSTHVPSPGINTLWHKHVSDTRSYKMMESLLLPPDQFIHHNLLPDDLSPSSHSYAAAALSDGKAIIKQRLHIRKQITDHLVRIGVKFLNLSRRDPAAFAVEYMRFMHLKGALDVDDQPSTLAPSPDIDVLWHKHLHDTRSHKMMESLLLPPGRYIHHNPFKDEQPGHAERLENTFMHYQDYFHIAPPSDIWGVEEDEEEEDAEEEDEVVIVRHAENRAVLAASSATVSFRVRMLTGKDVVFQFKSSDTVADLKIKIGQSQSLCPDKHRLIFNGRRLKDQDLLVGLNNGIVYLMLLRVDANQPDVPYFSRLFDK